MLHGANVKPLVAIYTESWRPPFEPTLNETLSSRILFPLVSHPLLAAPCFWVYSMGISESREIPDVQKRTRVRIRTLGLVMLLGAQAVIEAPSRTSPTEPTKQAGNGSARPAEPPAAKAWRILHEGLEDANSERRAKAVRALGLLAGSAEAEKAAAKGLRDEKTECAVVSSHGARFDARG